MGMAGGRGGGGGGGGSSGTGVAAGDVSFGVLGPLTVPEAARPSPSAAPRSASCSPACWPEPSRGAIDALVDAVWDHPPRSAERTLQAYVARLAGLEPGRPGSQSPGARTAGAGYRLRVGDRQLDALRFEELARHGSEQLADGDERAAATLREALASVAGRAYGEFATSRRARPRPAAGRDSGSSPSRTGSTPIWRRRRRRAGRRARALVAGTRSVSGSGAS